jgi:hypothetical protein
MKKAVAPSKTGEKIDWDSVCERTRQRCNKLSDEERQQLLEEGLRIINGSDAKKAIRSH